MVKVSYVKIPYFQMCQLLWDRWSINIIFFFEEAKMKFIKTQIILASTRNAKLEDLKSNIQRKSVSIYVEYSCIKCKLLQANQKRSPPRALETNKN